MEAYPTVNGEAAWQGSHAELADGSCRSGNYGLCDGEGLAGVLFENEGLPME